MYGSWPSLPPVRNVYNTLNYMMLPLKPDGGSRNAVSKLYELWINRQPALAGLPISCYVAKCRKAAWGSKLDA